MIRPTQKIGKPGPAKKIKNGLLVTARFRGNGNVGQTHDFLHTDTSNRNGFAYIPAGVDFSLIGQAEYYNTSRGWSTGSWDIVMEAQDQTGIVKSAAHSLVESVSCDPADLVVNNWLQELKAEYIPGDGGLILMRFSESADPTTFTICDGNFFETNWKLWIPGGIEGVDFIIDNPSITHLQEFEVKSL